MSKTSTLIYHEWAALFREMDDRDAKTIILALLEYDATGKEPAVEFGSDMITAIYNLMLEKTKNNRTVYLEKCEKNRINARKGGAPKGNQNASKQPKTTENNPKQPDRIGREGKGKDRIGLDGMGEEGNNIVSHPPTLSEIRSFCDDEGLTSVDAERFWNYYESKNWLIDGEPMNWQARIRVWDSQDAEKKKPNAFNDFSQRENSWDEDEEDFLK